MPASALPLRDARDDFLGHPKGVYVCFFTEMWERFSFYGMKALLLLYLTKYHLFGDKAGLDLLGAYGGLVYCVPVFGGLLADRWLGMRKAVVFGGVLLVLGHLGMAFEGTAATKVGDVHEIVVVASTPSSVPKVLRTWPSATPSMPPVLR